VIKRLTSRAESSLAIFGIYIHPAYHK